MKTAEEMLAEVETAISACLNAQSYSVADRQKTSARLDELRNFRRELLAEVNDARNGGQMSSVGQIDTPR